MTKPGRHQWPTDAATRKYVDRATDRLNNRCDKQTERIRSMIVDLKELQSKVDYLFSRVTHEDD